MSRPDAYVPLAITRRSGADESVHFGAVVALGPDGDVIYAAGDPGVMIYPRSSNKPMQALAMVRAGLALPPELLALVCASHDGTPAHVDAARRILAGGGLDDSALRNTPDLPLDPVSSTDLIRAGEHRRPVYMNCSGKHSGMLVTCVCNGWPHDDSYLDPEHPLQRLITATIAELSGEEPLHIGVDGCGAPAHVMSLVGLARCFRAIATGTAANTGSVGTTLVVTFTDASWNPATWIGMKDHEFDAYAANGTTKLNTAGTDRTAVLVATGEVDVTARQVRFTSDAANVGVVVAGSFIKFAGAHQNDMLGLQGIHSVSTLFNIPTTNAAWKPQTINVGGQLTYGKLNEGLELLQNLGFMGNLTLYTSGRGYRQLIDDQAAFVSHANSGRGPHGGKLSVGWDSIEFHGPCGLVKVKQHVLMKFGFSYAVPTQHCRRIGSSDLTFNQPGVGRTLIDIPDKNAVQIKIWCDQALYCDYPNALLQFTGITG